MISLSHRQSLVFSELYLGIVYYNVLATYQKSMGRLFMIREEPPLKMSYFQVTTTLLTTGIDDPTL